MTKQEVKDENKRIEGDPQVKGRIRQKQRQIGLARMMQMLQEADVVITNPTHFAVALSYKEGQGQCAGGGGKGEGPRCAAHPRTGGYP